PEILVREHLDARQLAGARHLERADRDDAPSVRLGIEERVGNRDRHFVPELRRADRVAEDQDVGHGEANRNGIAPELLGDNLFLVHTGIGLVMAFVSAVAVNWAYAREHDAVAGMPPFSLRKPRRFVAQLLSSRQWLLAFGTETAGWLVYIGSLRLAPLSLVQAVGAAGLPV